MNLKPLHPLLKIFIVLSFVCFAFLFYLAYINLSPQSAVINFINSFSNNEIVYDNTDLYSYSNPVDPSEVIFDILNILTSAEGEIIHDNITGLDVTEEFYKYAGSVVTFSSFRKLVTTWDNKYLAFNSNRLFLFQIIQNKIFLKSIDAQEINKLEFAYIFKSGNILFCDDKNAYYSHDNLSSFQKSLVLDSEGKQYQPNDHSNFFSLGIDGRQIVDGKEIRVWGNYSNYGVWVPGTNHSEKIQVWYTADEGKTIKTALSLDNNKLKIIYRHIHSVNMCPWDNTFWVQTGDMKNECHWIQGEYNLEEDLWNWGVAASGDEMSHFKSTGFVFLNNYLIWADDSSDPEKHGIWKTPYSNAISGKIDTGLFERVFKADKEIANMVEIKAGYILAVQYFKSEDDKYKIFYSDDSGKNWKTVSTSLQLVNIHPANDFGNVLGFYFLNQETFEAIHFWNRVPSIFVNSYLDKKN